MDQSVLDSLKKWPNVPNCFGWLAIDRRGEWRMRNEFTQANHLPGDIIRHVALRQFIERHYAVDQSGRFFFQNGPQRVFVTLDYTPWIVRLIPTENTQWQFETTSGEMIQPLNCLLDENGQIIIEADFRIILEINNQFVSSTIRSIALLHDHDLGIFSELASITNNACSLNGEFTWKGKTIPIEEVLSSDLPGKFKYQKNPSN